MAYLSTVVAVVWRKYSEKYILLTWYFTKCLLKPICVNKKLHEETNLQPN